VKRQNKPRKAEIGNRNWKSTLKKLEIGKVEFEKWILESRNWKIKL